MSPRSSKKRKEEAGHLPPAKRRKEFDNVKSEFRVVNSSLVLSVPPVFATNPLVGIQEMLDSMIMRYNYSLRGVVLSHSNITFVENVGRIQRDCPFLVCSIKFDATIWSPQIGDKLFGKVNLCSPDHISLLVHKTFNASVPRHHIPTETWEFEYGPAENDPEFGSAAREGNDDDSQAIDSNDNGGRWVHRVTGGVLGGNQELLEFTVIGLTVANEMLSLLGSLQFDPFSPRHVPHRKPEKNEGSNSEAESLSVDENSSDSEDSPSGSMSTNPSHILIARNSRGPNAPAAALSSPTETHAAASGIFRSSGSAQWLLEDCEAEELDSEMSADEEEEGIGIDQTFTKNCKLPGTVKVIVGSTTFWTHKEILFFASPFFEAALSGNWSETGRPASMSSVITISQPPSSNETSSESQIGVDPDTDPEALEVRVEFDPPSQHDDDPDRTNKERTSSLAKLQGTSKSQNNGWSSTSRRKLATAEAIIRRNPKNGPDAVIVLKEQKASTFHDFLKFVYPGLECTITWNNVAGLMNISDKLCVPSLQNECRTFLLTHAAGKPIKAMRIAELYQEEDLYRESSRFVLDNPGGWTEQELGTLSQDTLLKLEKRRNWFLERVLKLGLTMISKEYQCCPTCPDSSTCARLLEEKWRQAYHAVFRFGPPQPSMVFRYLRMLEGVSPPLALTHTACQASAKAFIATLFDRMFSLGVRGSGADAVPVPLAAVAAAAVNGPRRHFLFCTLKQDTNHKTKKSRDHTIS